VLFAARELLLAKGSARSASQTITGPGTERIDSRNMPKLILKSNKPKF